VRTLKGPGCVGCPFQHRGKYMVPDENRPGARVKIIGQNPGVEEEEEGRPFVGATGRAMAGPYFQVAALTRDECSIGNVIRCRVDGSNELPNPKGNLPADQELRNAISHCARAYGQVPAGTQLCVAQGDHAALGTTGDASSDEWRGWLVPLLGTRDHGRHLSEPWVPERGEVSVLVTVHLARLFRDPQLTLPTLHDWSKIPRILAGKWPRRPPRFHYGPVPAWPSRFSFDTEYVPAHNPLAAELLRYSLCAGTGDGQTIVCEAADHVPPVVAPGSVVVTQYAPADVHHFAALTGRTVAQVFDDFTIDDLVIKHAALFAWPEHNLDFLGSLWASINRWKHLREVQGAELLYAGCDALGEWEVDVALERELTRDPQSRRVYETIDRPAIPSLVEAQYAGVRVDRARLKQVMGQLDAERVRATNQAAAAVGWPINLNSPDQVGHQIYRINGLRPPGRKR